MGSGVLKPDMPGPFLFDPGFLWSTTDHEGDGEPKSCARFINKFLIDIVSHLDHFFVSHPDPSQDREWRRELIAT